MAILLCQSWLWSICRHKFSITSLSLNILLYTLTTSIVLTIHFSINIYLHPCYHLYSPRRMSYCFMHVRSLVEDHFHLILCTRVTFICLNSGISIIFQNLPFVASTCSKVLELIEREDKFLRKDFEWFSTSKE